MCVYKYVYIADLDSKALFGLVTENRMWSLRLLAMVTQCKNLIPRLAYEDLPLPLPCVISKIVIIYFNCDW